MHELPQEPAGAVRLLTLDDVSDSGRKNCFGYPLIGWQSTSMGSGGLFNPRGFAMLRVVVQKIVEGRLEDIYDQPMIVENAGAIAVCTLGRKVGMVQNFRLVGERIAAAPGDYVAQLNTEERWGELMASLGQWQWELPRGLAPPTNEADLEKFIIECAKLEALEEAGVHVANSRIAGRYNANPTFYPHAQYVVAADIESIGEQQPEDLEMMGEMALFSAEEIRAMVTAGQLTDSLTLAGLAVAGFHF